MNYTFTSFHRRLPGYSVKRAAAFSQNLRDALREIGLVRYGQIELVRNEGGQDFGSERAEQGCHHSLYIRCRCCGCFGCDYQQLVGLLEHGMSLEVVVAFLIFEIVMAVVIIPLVYGLWLAYDRLGALAPLRSSARSLRI
ncbi:MAG: hypothetical protein V8S24_16240 [Gordonibacter pamelaeae]